MTAGLARTAGSTNSGAVWPAVAGLAACGRPITGWWNTGRKMTVCSCLALVVALLLCAVWAACWLFVVCRRGVMKIFLLGRPIFTALTIRKNVCIQQNCSEK